MQRSLAYRFELYFYDIVIQILSKSGRIRSFCQQASGLFQSGEWIVISGSILASALAGLVSGYVLYLLFGGVG
jgi:hypothetical protein